MDRKNLLMIGAVILIAATLLAASQLMRPRSDVDLVVITVDGQERARIPLTKQGDYTLEQDDGVKNVVRVTAEGAVMLESTCDNQLCVHSGQVTRDNWELRPNGAFIICLPNRVSVELVVAN